MFSPRAGIRTFIRRSNSLPMSHKFVSKNPERALNFFTQFLLEFLSKISNVPPFCQSVLSNSWENWVFWWSNPQGIPADTPSSLIRVIAVCMKKAWVLSYPLSAQRRLWSDWADAQADLSLRWAHINFIGFLMRRLNSILLIKNNRKHTLVFHLQIYKKEQFFKNSLYSLH